LLDWDLLRFRSASEAKVRTVNSAQHVSIGFVGNRKQDGSFGPVGLVKRKLAIPDGTSVVLRVHGQHSNANGYKHSPSFKGLDTAGLRREGAKSWAVLAAADLNGPQSDHLKAVAAGTFQIRARSNENGFR
jgi:hypothetical protein